MEKGTILSLPLRTIVIEGRLDFFHIGFPTNSRDGCGGKDSLITTRFDENNRTRHYVSHVMLSALLKLFNTLVLLHYGNWFRRVNRMINRLHL